MTLHRSYTAARRPGRYVIRREPATRAELLAGGWTENQVHKFAWPRVVHAIFPDVSEQLVRHHVRHSPTGFEFRYHGSGPAELARCLLIDYFDLDEHADENLPLACLLPGVQARLHRPPFTRRQRARDRRRDDRRLGPRAQQDPPPVSPKRGGCQCPPPTPRGRALGTARQVDTRQRRRQIICVDSTHGPGLIGELVRAR